MSPLVPSDFTVAVTIAPEAQDYLTRLVVIAGVVAACVALFVFFAKGRM